MEWGGSPPDIWPQNQHFLVSFLALYFTRSYLYQFGIFWFSKILTWGVHIDLYSMEVRGKGEKLIRHQTHVFSYFHLCLHQGHSCFSSPRPDKKNQEAFSSPEMLLPSSGKKPNLRKWDGADNTKGSRQR